MPRDPEDQAHDDGVDEVMADYSVLQAEAQKIIADAQLATRKLGSWDDNDEQLRRANEIWKNSSQT